MQTGLETLVLPAVVAAGVIAMDRLHRLHRDLPTVIAVVAGVFAAVYLSAGGPTGFVAVLLARAAGKAVLGAPAGRSRAGAAIQAATLSEACSIASTSMAWAVESAVLLVVAGGLHLLHVRGRGRVFGLDWIPASMADALVGVSSAWTAAVTAVNDSVASGAKLSGALIALPEAVRRSLASAVAHNQGYPQAGHEAIERTLLEVVHGPHHERIREAAATLLLADREKRLAAIEALQSQQP